MEVKIVEELEQEWVQLMIEAKNLGLNIEDIRAFFLRHRNERPTITTPQIIQVKQERQLV